MPRKQATPAAASAAFAILSLAEATALSTSVATELFVTEYKNRRASFVRQGKLVYALQQAKLPRGQSIYGILKAQGVPEGSVHQAIMTADMLGSLVVAGHLPEARFDEIATFNVVRRARQLWTGKGKGGLKMDPADIAALMTEGSSAQIGAEMECLVEHGQTIAAREAALAEQQAERERLAAEAAEAERIKAEEAEKLKADLAAAQAERDRLAAEAAERRAAVPIEDARAPQATAEDPDDEEEADPADDEEEEEEADDTEEPEEEEEEESEEEADPDAEEEEEEEESEEEADPDAEEEEEEEEDEEPEAEAPPVVVTAAKPAGSSAPKPPAPTASLADITSRMDDLLLEALALDAADMGRLVTFLRKSANDLAATIPAELAAVA